MWPLLVGFQKAKELLFLGDTISAKEAERIGLVTYCVPDAELDARVDALADRLARGAKFAVAGTKRSINHTIRMLAQGTMENGLLLETLSHLTRDHGEAIDAFLAKRKPQFMGH
jgi:enoyl-CoA hydratase